MSSIASVASAAADLEASFGGQLLTPKHERLRGGEKGSQRADRQTAGIDRPLPRRCRRVDAVLLARNLGLEVAVRGGGHNVAGRATVDGGLMIDLSLMGASTSIPQNRTVRVQGGATWAEVNRETQLHGLAVTGGVVSTTGVAGLTLGGGIGWLMSKYGLALDNLRSVELVTADGEVCMPSSERKSRPVLGAARRRRQLRGGNLVRIRSASGRPNDNRRLDRAPVQHARDVLRFFRDHTAALPDEQTLFAALSQAPDGPAQSSPPW